MSIDLVNLEAVEVLGAKIQGVFELNGNTIQMSEVVVGADSMIRHNRRDIERSISRLLKVQVAAKSSLPVRSASHSWFEDRLAVIVIAGQKAVGIDIENTGRKVHPRVYSRILNPKEQSLGLTSIEAWTIKEAAFKAFPKNQGTTVSQYRIISWDHAQKQGLVQFPDSETQSFFLTQVEGWQIAICEYDEKC